MGPGAHTANLEVVTLTEKFSMDADLIWSTSLAGLMCWRQKLI